MLPQEDAVIRYVSVESQGSCRVGEVARLRTNHYIKCRTVKEKH